MYYGEGLQKNKTVILERSYKSVNMQTQATSRDGQLTVVL